MSKKHRLDLLKNSISYFREAVFYAQRETDDTNHWKFAIVNVVQAMELAFKECLRRIHPVFIYESVDQPGKTVSLRDALARLNNPQIGNLQLTEPDKRKIAKAVDLRGDLTHHEFGHSHEYIEAKFAEIFSFMIYFYRRQLQLETADFIAEDQHQTILKLVQARNELMARAKDHIGERDSWACPKCLEYTFLPDEGQCCVCHFKESVVECPNCGVENRDSELIDIEYLFDWDYEEGLTVLRNGYGLEHDNIACPECIRDVQNKIDDMRASQYHEDMAMEEYYARKM